MSEIGPSREELLGEGRIQARIHGVDPACAQVYAEGWAAAMARADRAIEEAQRAVDKSMWDASFNAELATKRRIADLERQLRCVQMYGYGYLLRHGSEQIALDPKDVTVVLPASRHMDDFDLHNSLHLAEERIEELKKQLAECKASPSAGAVQVVVRCDVDDARAVLDRFVSITAPGLGVTEGLLSAATDLGGGAVNLRLECDGDTHRFFRSLRGESYGFNFTPDTGLTLTPIPVHPSDVEP
jgi:hypothetical protein